MAVLDRLNSDMKEAMKARDKFRLSVIRMLKGAIQKEQIDRAVDALSDEDELVVLSREHKQRLDSLSEFKEAGRDDLVEQTQKELAIVEEYMPRQLSEDEIQKNVEAIITELKASSMKDFGKVMGLATKEMKGQASGSTIQKIAKALLAHD